MPEVPPAGGDHAEAGVTNHLEHHIVFLAATGLNEGCHARVDGDLRAIGQGNDVTITGSIAPETPASGEGLALYETWENAWSKFPVVRLCI